MVRRLKADFPTAECALLHDSPVQLLVATILSAQCTDERVNLVTRGLFAAYPDAPSLARAPVKRLESLVKSAGFYRNKAKNIKRCCQTLVDQHGGEVPREMDALVVLPGVGRKTANVVLGVAFGIASGVVVDTHVGRLSRRMGLTEETDPVKVERDLVAVLPKREWVDFSHRMIYHGRAVCGARKPKCDACSMQRFCPRAGVA
ncbi:MAG: endonuclease III [Planctomycetota bacterium]